MLQRSILQMPINVRAELEHYTMGGSIFLSIRVEEQEGL